MRSFSFKILIAFLAASITFSACKEKAGDETAETTTTQSPTASTPQQPGATDPQNAGLASIEIEAMRELWESSDAVDIIFYETNFSLSQTDQAAIRNTLGYFSPAPIAHNANCKPLGRITFLIKGDIRREADFYTQEGCQYFLWMDGTKPYAINPMGNGGVEFFDGVVKKGKNLGQ